MQSTTGCKINVSQASGGADIEREIGLVGTRQAIEDAKKAIWEKVDSVVSMPFHKVCLEHTLTVNRNKRMAAVTVVIGKLEAVIAAAIVIATHNSHPMASNPQPRLCLKDKLTPPLQQTAQLIRMPFMAVTRTIWLCGIPRLLNSSSSSRQAKVTSRDSRMSESCLVPLS